MKYRWSIIPSQPAIATQLAESLQISPLLAQCLLNRGFSDPLKIGGFLDPKLKQLADPFLLPNMQAAVDRLLQARDRKEALVIFGDYDVDGVTSTALLNEVLSKLGWTVHFYLPHRMEEGYGLSQDGVENCLGKFPVKLLLAVDCGSTAVQTIAWLAEKGVDVLVLDHHQISNPAPAAVALVNPQLGLEFRELCSAGLAFKLAHALVKRLRDSNDPVALSFDLRPLLDLVALGTIADIVPLIGENRILATAGLTQLSRTERPGLIALKTVAQTAEVVTSYEVGFQLGPRLNAAGRLETAESALSLLLAENLAEAEPLAEALDTQNRERQKIEKQITEQVIGALRARFNPETDFCIVQGDASWHIGVVGIVASRVLQEFYRPTIVLGGDAEGWRGSGRSIEGFDLAAALRECGDLLVRHGGHAMAAGLSIRPEQVEAFRCRLNELVRRSIKPEQLKPALRVDAEVELATLTLAELEGLERLKPSGPGNPQPNLVIRNLTHQRPPQRIGKEGQHAKFFVTDGKITVDALWWNCGSDTALPKVLFDLACTPQINEFNGRRSVQLKVLDWESVVGR